jgi:hypothetical protein
MTSDTRFHPGRRGPREPQMTYGGLHASEQRLIRLVHQVGYGALTNIPIQHGKPVLAARHKAIRQHRLGQPDAPGADPVLHDDFLLKKQHRDLIARLRAVRDGRIVTLEIQNGLPLQLKLEEDITG